MESRAGGRGLWAGLNEQVLKGRDLWVSWGRGHPRSRV